MSKGLPRKVTTEHGPISGFKFASELSQGQQTMDETYKPKPQRQYEVAPRIESLREALEYFKYQVDATKLDDISLEGARVAALFRRDSDKQTFVVMYKREFYLHFSRHFMHIPDTGYGLLANHKLVHWAALSGHRIAAVFPDGRCYWCSAMDFLRYYEEYETECPKLPGEIAYPLSKVERLF